MAMTIVEEAEEESDPYAEHVTETVSASEAGFHEESFALIDEIIRQDTSHGFPGAQLAVMRNGKLVYHNSWGTINTETGEKVTDDTLFDLASVTKVFGVNYAVQKLVSEGKLDLDSKVTDHLGEAFAEDVISIDYAKGVTSDIETQKEWKRRLTLKDLLMHQAGFPADPRYCNPNIDAERQEYDPEAYNILFAGNGADEETKEATTRAIFKTPLIYEPGSNTVYSDVDYMVLGLVIEKVTGTDLDTYLKENFCYPLGLRHITYKPLENGFEQKDCAATELYGNTREGYVDFEGIRDYTLQGEVHDEKAWYSMAGISGHAGLFSNAIDLADLGDIMLTGERDGTLFFTKEVIDEFTAPKSGKYKNWGLGWWRQGDMQRKKYFGSKACSKTFGHQGWTGTLIMIDPEKNIVIAFLTNKINTPLTDRDENPNKFDGDWYTTAALGFVPEILYTGLDEDEDVSEELFGIAEDLKEKASESVTSSMPEVHPAVRNLKSKEEVMQKYIVSEINNFAYYNASGGCARIL